MCSCDLGMERLVPMMLIWEDADMNEVSKSTDSTYCSRGHLCDRAEVNREWIHPQGYKGIFFIQNSCLKNIIFCATSVEVR